MKNNYSKEFGVGLFAVIGIGFIIGLGLFFNKDSFEKEGRKYYVVYSFLNGLQQGASVKYAGGLTVGKITGILPYGDQAKVEILVDSNIKVMDTTTFKIISAGLLGEKFINISLSDTTLPEGQEPVPVKPGSVIIGSQDAGMDKLFDTVSELANKLTTMAVPLAQIFNQLSEEKTIVRLISDIQKLISTSNSLLNSSKPKVQSMISNINDILTKANKGQGVIGKIINDREMANSLKDTINSLKILIDNLTRNPVIGRSQKRESNNVRNFYSN